MWRWSVFCLFVCCFLGFSGEWTRGRNLSRQRGSSLKFKATKPIYLMGTHRWCVSQIHVAREKNTELFLIAFNLLVCFVNLRRWKRQASLLKLPWPWSPVLFIERCPVRNYSHREGKLACCVNTNMQTDQPSPSSPTPLCKHCWSFVLGLVAYRV